MKNIKHWVFDLDGTLVDSFSGYFETLEDIFNKFEVPYEKKDIVRALTMHSREYLSLYFDEKQSEYAIQEILRRSAENSAHTNAFEGLEKSLQHLKAQGARLAVWTGRDLNSAELVLKKTNLDHYFDYCVSGTCVENHKPHPEGLIRILNDWNCDSESVLMVGDHEVDMIGSDAAGISGIRVSWATEDSPKCDRAKLQFFEVKPFVNWVIENH
ncbi:MAG: HAD family hydrolase [Bdellovibrionales bacterium]|nr:HAD family hydrolase [Bdellovibrionales bacterium]